MKMTIKYYKKKILVLLKKHKLLLLLFKEIELELKRGEASKLDKLAGELTRMSGLKPARISKVQTAVALWKLWEGK